MNSGEDIQWDIQAGSLAVVAQSGDPSAVLLTPSGDGGLQLLGVFGCCFSI